MYSNVTEWVAHVHNYKPPTVRPPPPGAVKSDDVVCATTELFGNAHRLEGAYHFGDHWRRMWLSEAGGITKDSPKATADTMDSGGSIKNI